MSDLFENVRCPVCGVQGHGGADCPWQFGGSGGARGAEPGAAAPGGLPSDVAAPMSVPAPPPLSAEGEQRVVGIMDLVYVAADELYGPAEEAIEAAVRALVAEREQEARFAVGWQARAQTAEAQAEALRAALRYVIETREVECVSPVCKSGETDNFCAYHKALRVLAEEEEK